MKTMLILLTAMAIHAMALAQTSDFPVLLQAQQRIDSLRKENLSLKIVDERGRPIKNAQVEIKMLRNAFDFGCAISASGAFTPEGPKANMQQYLEIFSQNFNTAVMENSLKWPVMTDKSGEVKDETVERVWRCIEWLDAQNIPLRGHNVLWPSWENMPKYLKDHEGRPWEIQEIVEERMKHVLTTFQGRLYEWDLINEPVHHRDLLNIFGEPELAYWFEMAKNYDSTTPLYINQWYALNGTYHQEYIRLLHGLQQANAPVDGIGLQGHLDVEHFTEAGEIEKIWQKLDEYAAFDLPIKITEFDLNGDEGEDKQAQALENALTLFYSHPAVDGLLIWGFWEPAHWRKDEQAGLWREDWTAKPAVDVWKKLVLDKWMSNESGKTNKEGVFAPRVFTGSYEVVVNHKGKKMRHVMTLQRGDAEKVLTVQ